MVGEWDLNLLWLGDRGGCGGRELDGGGGEGGEGEREGEIDRWKVSKRQRRFEEEAGSIQTRHPPCVHLSLLVLSICTLSIDSLLALRTVFFTSFDWQT